MIARFAIAAVAVTLPLATAASAAPTSPAGRWLTEGNQAIVEIAPCGPALCGAIVKVLKPDPKAPKTDVNNPDPSLRNRPTSSLRILTGFVPDRARWKGQVYDPRSGRTYKSFLAVQADGTLALTGCVWKLCQTQSWRRAQGPGRPGPDGVSLGARIAMWRVVPRDGIEPPTLRFSVACSTN